MKRSRYWICRWKWNLSSKFRVWNCFPENTVKGVWNLTKTSVFFPKNYWEPWLTQLQPYVLIPWYKWKSYQYVYLFILTPSKTLLLLMLYRKKDQNAPSKKDKILHCNVVADCMCAPSMRCVGFFPLDSYQRFVLNLVGLVFRQRLLIALNKYVHLNTYVVCDFHDIDW